MTRFQQTENTAHTSPAHSEVNTSHPNYSGGAQQHNFSEYTMPSTSSRTANPNNVQGQALQNAQTYQPVQTARTYSPAQNAQTYAPAQTTQTYSPTQTARTYQPTTNPASTPYNYNTGTNNGSFNGNNTGNNWNNQNQQAQWYREMQLRQLQQQALQASLYYGATNPNYLYGNQGYDYNSQWGGDPSYQYGTNYNGQYIPGQQNLGYQDPRYNQGNGVDYAGGSGYDANGNPIGAQSGNPGIDYGAGATYDQSGNLINPNLANNRGAQGNPIYRPVQDGGNYAGAQGNPNYADAQGNPIYRPVPGGANNAGAQGLDQNYQGRIPAQPDPSMYAGADRYAQGQRSGQDQVQGQGRRRQNAPQTSGSCPDLTESSYGDGPTTSGPVSRGDRPVQPGRAPQGSDHWAAAEGGANWNQYDFAVYKHLNDQAKALVGHSIQEFDKNIPVRLGCARAISLLVNQGYGFNTTDSSVRNLEQDLRKNGFTQVSIKDMQPGDVICGYRAKGDYPHGALYLGNGQIFNNDSNSGVMQIQSIAKLNNSSFKNFVVLRRPATVPAVQGDARMAQN